MPLKQWEVQGTNHLSRNPVPVLVYHCSKAMLHNGKFEYPLRHIWTNPTCPAMGHQGEQLPKTFPLTHQVDQGITWSPDLYTAPVWIQRDNHLFWQAGDAIWRVPGCSLPSWLPGHTGESSPHLAPSHEHSLSERKGASECCKANCLTLPLGRQRSCKLWLALFSDSLAG